MVKPSPRPLVPAVTKCTESKVASAHAARVHRTLTRLRITAAPAKAVVLLATVKVSS